MDRTQICRGDNNMRSQLRPALVALGIFTILTGLVYPLVVTGLAQVIFPRRANGSLIVRNGQPVGSELIGQPFDDPKYFWGRLSATSPAGYTAFNGDKLTGSSGSNYGPLNPALKDAMQARIDALKAGDRSIRRRSRRSDHRVGQRARPADQPGCGRVPGEAGSQGRGLDAARVRELVAQHIEGRTFSIPGERRVNVLELNLALNPGSNPRKPCAFGVGIIVRVQPTPDRRLWRRN